MAMPQVPPRPNRSHVQHPSTATIVEPPKVPPRPTNQYLDRSESPNRDSFARSPLSGTPFAMNYGDTASGIYSSNPPNASGSNLGLPARPPSVTLPSVGQEGNEYAELAYDEPENVPDGATSASPTQTRNVGSDLPLYAPKPSLSTTSAKARIATVTRIDSSQAAAAGFGKANTPLQLDDKDPHTRTLKGRESFSSTRSSASTERPGSAQVEDEHGIPEIGQRVPMYPNAGDVQAPSPAPYSQTHPSGVGFHNDGSKPRHHGRTRSGRETFQGPPGSYGLHGHGLANPDKFERAWYDKHPDALLREESGQYSPGIGGGRGEWAMSSEDLNKIVKDTASRGSGFGTSPDVVGRPDEQIGYLASEEYASRLNSPRPQSTPYHNKAHSHSQTHVESPLRKASFPIDTSVRADFERSRDSGYRPSEEQALESEAEDEDVDVIHIDQPEVRISKLTGNGYDPPTEDLGPRGENTISEGGWIEETGYGVPILASDEVAKTPGLEYLQPAVAPSQERRGSGYHTGTDSDVPLSYQSGHRHGSRSGSASSSRTTSRPGSIHSSLPGLAKFTSIDDREEMHTPLEDVDEYEPLFPDDEAESPHPHTPADRFKQRPDMKRRFPSQDIWEDTPNSLQLQATVSTPEPAVEQPKEETIPASTIFETPEKEAARKGEVGEEEKTDLLSKEERWSRSNFKPHIREETQRPGLKQRFPSSDIWEDSPDSACLQTTVGGPQEDEVRSPPDEGRVAGAVVRTSGRPVEGKQADDQAREGATTGAPAVDRPSIPPRPLHKKSVHEAPISVLHAPPSVPARPQKARTVPPANVPSPLSRGFDDVQPVNIKQASPIEPRKATVLPERVKPHVPARPVKPTARDSSEGVPLAKKTSSTSLQSNTELSSPKDVTSPPPAPKPKPFLPARPAGSKIAALKAGFMSDLDKRLQLGPQAPIKAQEKLVEEEQEGEKAPLADARKGRTRGPVRRKPAASPAATEDDKPKVSKLEIADPWTVWHVSPEGDGSLNVLHAAMPTKAKTSTETPKEQTLPDSSKPPVEPLEHSTNKVNASVSILQSQHDSGQQETTGPRSLDSMDDSHVTITEDVYNTTDTAKNAASENEPTQSPPATTNVAVQPDVISRTMDTISDAPVKLTAHEGAAAQRLGDPSVVETAEVEGEHAEEV